MLRPNLYLRKGLGAVIILACKLLGLAWIIFLSNADVVHRFMFTLQDGRYLTSAIFVLLWGISLVAVAVAAFQPRLIWRLVWAIPIAAASACAYGYYLIQSNEFYVFDVLSIWASRHEIDRASEFYHQSLVWAGLVFALGITAFVMPPAPRSGIARTWLGRLVCFPMVPVFLIAGVVLYRDGKGSDNLPKQFSPLSLITVAAIKLNSGTYEARQHVDISPGTPLVRTIVLLVDESVRADHVSLTPGNPFTPDLAELHEHWIDFGPAGSAANCSATSNALLRFMATHQQVVHSVRRSPTIWQYAKAAGYRTVFIDAQAPFIKGLGKLQNYMTIPETADIDRLYKLDASIPTSALDDELLRIVLSEMKAGGPVLIYADKQGSHFPYVNDYPHDNPTFTPSETPPGADPRLGDYRSAIRWSTDRVMAAFTKRADLSDGVAIYTSDHGQHFHLGELTHCASGNNVHPDEGVVPLMVSTQRADLAERFQKVAAAGHGLATHFAIAPTVLRLAGYHADDVGKRYDTSLLDGLTWKPSFVSDDIFGLFSETIFWHRAPLDAQVAMPAGSAITP